MNTNKDIIEDIKAKLKEVDEIPYREGAWERFTASKNKDIKVVPISMRWKQLAAAAVAMLISATGIYYYMNSVPETERPMAKVTTPSKTITSPDVSQGVVNKMQEDLSEDYREYSLDASSVNLQESSSSNASEVVPNLSSSLTYKDAALSSISADINLRNIEIRSINNTIPLLPSPSYVSLADLPAYIPQPITDYTALSKQNNTVSSRYEETPTGGFKNKLVGLGDKMQLGLYVSPFKTSDRFDVGAGVLVSYHLSNKVSLRTGASYNAYTVGVMKDPLEKSNTEKVYSNDSYYNKNNIIANNADYQATMILPNINAVLGKVESIEIPLDVTYSFRKDFYASAGVSYSNIVRQERQAEFIENAGVQSLQSAASKDINKVITKTVKSTEPNVNTNGFNGFVNFSLGKSVNLNKKVSLSLEPYFKIPVGQFRKSDLDYTNSGIRIITNF